MNVAFDGGTGDLGEIPHGMPHAHSVLIRKNTPTRRRLQMFLVCEINGMKPVWASPGLRVFLWTMWLVMLILFCGAMAHAQLADLDLLEADDRSVGVSVTSAPDPVSGNFTESRSGILLLPLSIRALKFEGGFGTYFTQSIAAGESASALQWRVQGGPQFGYLGLQFYVEGFWKQGIDYAGFFRVGEFDLGRVIVSGGFGTLVRADTQAELGGPGIERNAPGGGDTKVKGLLLASAEFDTNIFESCRVLGSVLPGLEGEHDFVVEPQVTYALGDINIAGLARFGYERGDGTRRYTLLVQVPF